MIVSIFLCLFASLTSVLCATCSTSGEPPSIVRVTRLSPTAASVEFIYSYQPGQSLLIETNQTNVTANIVSSSLSESKLLYDYHFNDLDSSVSSYCFRIVVQPEFNTPNNSFCCLSADSQSTSGTVSDLRISRNNPPEVSFQWTVQGSSIKTIIYCTERSSNFITHKEFNDLGTTQVTLSQFVPAKRYTCYIAGGNRISIDFTTRPQSPRNLTGSSNGPNSISLSWQHESLVGHRFNVTYIEGCLENGPKVVSTTPVTLTTTTLTHLTSFTLYCITVRSELDGIMSDDSTTLRVRTQGTVPGPVRNLVATPTNSTAVLVSWSEPSVPNGVITGYRVERIGCFLCAMEVEGNVTFIIIIDLDPCTEYTFHVSARTDRGLGESTFVSTRTLYEIPATPQLSLNRQRGFIGWTRNISTSSACVSGITVTFDPIYSLEKRFEIEVASYIQSIPIPTSVKETESYYVSITAFGPGGRSEPSPPSLSTPELHDSQSFARTNLIQVRLTGAESCVNSTAIRDALLDRISFICLEASVFTITEEKAESCAPNPILFRANVSSSTGASRIFQCLEHWYNKTLPLLEVSDQVLYIDHTCSQFYIESLSDTSCMPRPPESAGGGNSDAVAGGLIGGVIIGAVLSAVVVVIVILVCFRRKLLQKNTMKSGVGSCTVLDTVGTAKKYRPKKKGKKSHDDQPKPQTFPAQEGNYEMFLYQGEDERQSEYVDNPSSSRNTSNAHQTAPSQKTRVVDSDYEVPDVFIADRQKALAAANAKKAPDYDIPEVVETGRALPDNTQHPPVNQKPSLNRLDSGVLAAASASTSNGNRRMVTNNSQPNHEITSTPAIKNKAMPVHEASYTPTSKNKTMPVHTEASYTPAIKTETLPVHEKTSTRANKAKAMPLHENLSQAPAANKVKAMPLLPPTKVKAKEDTLPQSSQDGTKKKSPLLPKPGKATDTKEGTSVASKTKMLESMFGPPKPKPKPKDKEANNITCSGNSAYEKWNASN